MDLKKPLDLRNSQTRRTNSTNNNNNNEQFDRHYAPAGDKKELQKITQPSIKQVPLNYKWIIFIVALVIVVAVVYMMEHRKPAPAQQAQNTQQQQSKWYSVKMVNGETFYGQITDVKADPVVMDNAYYNYDQTTGKSAVVDDTTGNLRLVKRGQETSGPSGQMDLVRSQIVYMEPLRDDSKVLQAIMANEKQQ